MKELPNELHSDVARKGSVEPHPDPIPDDAMEDVRHTNQALNHMTSTSRFLDNEAQIASPTEPPQDYKATGILIQLEDRLASVPVNKALSRDLSNHNDSSCSSLNVYHQLLASLDTDIIMEDVPPALIPQPSLHSVPSDDVHTAFANMRVKGEDLEFEEALTPSLTSLFPAPSHSFLPDTNLVIQQQKQVSNGPSGLPESRWFRPKDLKDPIKYKKLKKSPTTSFSSSGTEVVASVTTSLGSEDDDTDDFDNGTTSESMHAVSAPPNSYDAYVELRDIEAYSTIEQKCAFIDINLRDNTRGFKGVTYCSKERQFIAAFNSYSAMCIAARKFNEFFKDTYLRLHAKQYYTLDGIRISSKDFKILDVPNSILVSTIETSLRRILHARRFHIKQNGIKKRNNTHNTVFFTSPDPVARNTLKSTWSIEIDGELYRLAPAHFKEKDFAVRKRYQGEFTGFDPLHNLAKAMEVTAPFNPKNSYRQTLDKFVVEFQSEADLFNAVEKTYYFGSYVVKGSPRSYNWTSNHRKLMKPPVPHAPPVTVDPTHITVPGIHVPPTPLPPDKNPASPTSVSPISQSRQNSQSKPPTKKNYTKTRAISTPTKRSATGANTIPISNLRSAFSSVTSDIVQTESDSVPRQ